MAKWKVLVKQKDCYSWRGASIPFGSSARFYFRGSDSEREKTKKKVYTARFYITPFVAGPFVGNNAFGFAHNREFKKDVCPIFEESNYDKLFGEALFNKAISGHID